jgi:hypothetical protein
VSFGNNPCLLEVGSFSRKEVWKGSFEEEDICSKMNPLMDSHLISEHHGGKILARYTELISKIERHSIDVIQNFAELICTLRGWTFLQFQGSLVGLFSSVSMGEFCSIRIAPINLDLRDIVDVFPFLNRKDAKGAKERLYVRRVKRRTYIVSPKGQSLLCVPCGLVVHCKQRGIMKIARLFKDLDKSGSAVFPTDMLRKDSTLLSEWEALRA